jgi:hypothetical protein
MSEEGNSKPFDLEDRTFAFAKRIRDFIKMLSMTIANLEDVRQLVRSSGSVGANYIEANEACSKKDFVLRIKFAVEKPKNLAIGCDVRHGRRSDLKGARGTRSGGAGIHEHLWRHSAPERNKRRFDYSLISPLSIVLGFDIRVSDFAV